MLDGRVIATVVPALDEAEFITEVIETMPYFVDRIIVVDDASRDATSERTARARGHAPVEVIRHAQTRGVGAAITTGYRAALRAGADVVAVMAGDGQMAPEELLAVVLPIVRGEADYVKGNRLRHHAVWRVMPKGRLLGSIVLSELTTWAIGQPIHDSQCGFTAIGRDALRRIGLDTLWARFGYPNDLLATIARSGGRIVEVEVSPIYRGEQSHLRAHHVFTILYLIARARLRRSTLDPQR
ncbi:MAG: glycosyltransferase family 2 protein [Deltaproteobacteria bacterium]|nr:glycosyltransferase family 2 protein [Deltaproteobacteria bacterium]